MASLDRKVQELQDILDKNRSIIRGLEEQCKRDREEKTQVEKEMLRLHRRLTELNKNLKDADKQIGEYQRITDESEAVKEQLIHNCDMQLEAIRKASEEVSKTAAISTPTD